MDDDSTHVHQLNTTTRAICSHVTNDPGVETSRFYAGTCSTHEQNKIYVIDFDDYENSINVEAYKTMVTTSIWQIQHYENFLATISDAKVQLYDSKSLKIDTDENNNHITTENLESEQEEVENLSNLEDRETGSGDERPQSREPPVVIEKISQASSSKVPSLTLKNQFEFENHTPLYLNFSNNESYGTACNLSVLYPQHIKNYDLETFQENFTISLPEKSHIKKNLERGELKHNLHDPFNIYACGGKFLNLFDTRTPDKAEIEIASNYKIRSFDINPNRPDWVTVAGDDRNLHIFDIRNCSAAFTSSFDNVCYLDNCSDFSQKNCHLEEKPYHQLNTMHTHWIWKIRYNPFHDRLLLTGGSDNRYLLFNYFEACSDNIKKTKWRESVISNSSDPDKEKNPVQAADMNEISNQESQNSELPEPEEEDEDNENYMDVRNVNDGVVVCYEDFDDSVYDLAWSNSDPWIYMACSYDGRLVLSHVPKDLKYSILL